jgi:GNAT superfamily N-acetyltransferase
VATIPLDLNGYTDLPPGLIANVVTFLEKPAPSGTRPERAGTPYGTQSLSSPSTGWYRALYRRIGERWLWFERAILEDERLAAWLAAPTTEILALKLDKETVGFAELDWSVAGDVEVAMFGIVPEVTAKGAASFLMEAVEARAAAEGVGRIWLHTCTFDHPAAIPFYRRAGFRPYKFAVEVTPDPRLAGHLPREAGPHVPLIEP